MPSDDDGRFGLPPFRLPPFVPESIRIVLPTPRGRIAVGGGHPLAAALVVDAVDASAAFLLAPGPIHVARTAVMAALAALLLGRLGALAAWELGPAAAGATAATLAPSTTLLALWSRRRG